MKYRAALRNLATATVALAFAFFPFAGATAQKIDPALYGSLPTVSHAQISPDGNSIVQVQSDDTGQAVVFYDLTGQSGPVGSKFKEGEVRDLVWADEDYALILLSASKRAAASSGIGTYEFFRWISVNRRDGSSVRLFSDSTRQNMYTYSGALYSALPDDPGFALMSHVSNTGTYSLYRVNLQNGRSELVERGHRANRFGFRKFSGTVDWVVDSDGAPAVRIDYDITREERRFYRPSENGEDWILASTIPEKEEEDIKVLPHGLANNPNHIYASMDEGGFRKLFIFDIEKGAAVEKVFEAGFYDVESALKDPRSARLIGITYIDDFRKTHFVDPNLDRIQKNLEKALPGAAPFITSWSRDFSKFLVRVSYTDHPGQFFLYDREKNSLMMTAATFAKLDGKVQAKKEKFDYLSSDGMRIPGYLTVPVGSDKSNMPMVVLPHGGPWERNIQAFDWWAFFYAARGYIVYQPNFRGSFGYGTPFKIAGQGEWGGKMQDDITEGVQKLVADGVVDPARICIAGSEYGGYAALAGATLTPDLYACAVSVNGITNVLQLLADAAGEEAESEYWKERIGSRFSDDKALRAVSPIYQVTSATPPTMVIRSEHDVVIPEGHSRRMRNALRDKGIENEFILLKDEDHWLSTEAGRTEMLRASIEFIDRHIGQ